jgi:hypothetical protein
MFSPFVLTLLAVSVVLWCAVGVKLWWGRGGNVPFGTEDNFPAMPPEPQRYRFPIARPMRCGCDACARNFAVIQDAFRLNADVFEQARAALDGLNVQVNGLNVRLGEGPVEAVENVQVEAPMPNALAYRQELRISLGNGQWIPVPLMRPLEWRIDRQMAAPGYYDDRHGRGAMAWGRTTYQLVFAVGRDWLLDANPNRATLVRPGAQFLAEVALRVVDRAPAAMLPNIRGVFRVDWVDMPAVDGIVTIVAQGEEGDLHDPVEVGAIRYDDVFGGRPVRGHRLDEAPCPRCRRVGVEHTEETCRAEVDRLAEVQRIAAEKAEQAKARARQLLLDYLTPAQRTTYEANGYFVTQAKGGNRYKVTNANGLYRVFPLPKNSDRPWAELCIIPNYRGPVYPEGDVMLSQKLMIETDEERFLKTANIIQRFDPLYEKPPGPPGPYHVVLGGVPININGRVRVNWR